MQLNNKGEIIEQSYQESEIPKAQPIFNKVKQIHSIYLNNAIKTTDGYLFTQESISKTIKSLTNYLKNNL